MGPAPLVLRSARRPSVMNISQITLLLLVCALVADADIAHLKAAKAKLISRLKGKHHKRGVLSPIPTYKVGYDIPHVTHSLLKPLVVTYPPTATVAAVKIPVPSPPGDYPVPVGHKVHGLPHPHYGLKFPHTKFITKPDHHFHHHHHHVSPTPVVPVVPAPVAPVPPAPVVVEAARTPIFPIPQPTAVAHPVPLPSPPLILPPALPQAPIPLAAPSPFHFLPQSHLYRHLRPILPAAAVPLQPALLQAPALPSPVPYVIRPGGAVQTSVFATYPRYPFINSYQAPLIPLSPAQAVSSVQQLNLQRPQVHVPQFNVVHGGESGVIQHHTPNIVVDQTPTYVHPTQVTPQPEIHLHPTLETLPQTPIHLHPTQLPQPAVHLQPAHPTVSIDHDGWSPVPAQPHDITAAHQPEAHYPNVHQFTQEQGTQVYEHHDQFHDYQHQLQHHLHQIEQAQYDQNLNNQHHVAQEYGTPQQGYGQPNEYPQQGQDVSLQGDEYQQHGQVYSQSGQDVSQQGQDFLHHGQDFSQHGQDFAQHGQDIAQHGQDFSQHGQDFAQHGQDFAHNGQDFSQHNHNFAQNEYDLAQHNQYGLPQQGVEGRSGEDNGDLFHNHIPLALQPPIDRPLDHFR